MQEILNNMKKILLFALPLLAFAFISKAQLTYSVGADTSYINLANDNTPQKAKFTVTNSTGTDIPFEWQIMDHFKPWTWTAPGVCDWNLCYQFEDRTWHTAVVPANSSRELYVEMTRDPALNPEEGCGFAVINYREQGMASNTVQLKLTSHADYSPCGALNTSKFTKESVQVFPNPTTNILNLDVINKNVKTVQLTNIIGKQIQRLTIANGGSHQLSLQALPKGIYMLQFKNQSGKVIGVKRITKM